AVAATSLNEVIVFENFGAGILESPPGSVIRNLPSPVGIVAGDFNRDGQQDLAVVSNVRAGSENPAYNVSIILQGASSPGRPQFLTPHNFDTGLTVPPGLAVGNLHQQIGSDDGQRDLVVSAADGLRILFNTTPANGTLNSVSFRQSPVLTTQSTVAVAV